MQSHGDECSWIQANFSIEVYINLIKNEPQSLSQGNKEIASIFGIDLLKIYCQLTFLRGFSQLGWQYSASSAHACGRRGFHLAVLKTFSKSLSTLAGHASSLNQQKMIYNTNTQMFFYGIHFQIWTLAQILFKKNTSIVKTLGLLNK